MLHQRMLSRAKAAYKGRATDKAMKWLVAFADKLRRRGVGKLLPLCWQARSKGKGKFQLVNISRCVVAQDGCFGTHLS